MEILSFGAGMQSTALALMSCENAMAGGRDYYPHPLIPVYDAVIFATWDWKLPECTNSCCLCSTHAKKRVSPSMCLNRTFTRTIPVTMVKGGSSAFPGGLLRKTDSVAKSADGFVPWTIKQPE